MNYKQTTVDYISSLTPEQRVALQSLFLAQFRIHTFLDTKKPSELENCGSELDTAVNAAKGFGRVTFGLVEFIEKALDKNPNIKPEEIYSLILKFGLSVSP